MASYEECECIKNTATVIEQANKIETIWKDYEYDFATRDNTKKFGALLPLIQEDVDELKEDTERFEKSCGIINTGQIKTVYMDGKKKLSESVNVGNVLIGVSNIRDAVLGMMSNKELVPCRSDVELTDINSLVEKTK